jgi:flagellin FlaB
MRTLHRLYGEQWGVTALETAIILIAFVVVASVFAFTILSAGTFTTERSKEAVYAGLAEVRGSVELKGSMIGIGGSSIVSEVIFSVAQVAGGAPIDFTSGSNRVVLVEYRDQSSRQEISNWTVNWLGYNDSDDLLEPRELAEITVPLSTAIGLGTNTTFVVEVKPPQGAVLNLQRTTPPHIETVMELN